MRGGGEAGLLPAGIEDISKKHNPEKAMIAGRFRVASPDWHVECLAGGGISSIGMRRQSMSRACPFKGEVPSVHS